MPTTPKRSSARCCAQGYSQVETPEEADLVLYNTCSIRDKAEQKVFNRLQNFKREAGKGKVFGVLGCVAQQEGEKIFERAPHVSLVAGSASYTRLPEMLVQLEAGNRRVTGLSLDTDETFDTPFTRRDNPHRAYITIIEGCDKSCAYCVVPFTRGPERSRTSESVMDEARRLAEPATPKSSCSGQNVNSYRDPSPAGWDFATLLARVGRDPRHPPRALHHVAPARFRASAIIDAMDSNPVICDHVHLPVQSGSTRVLAAMQRLYTRDEYMRRIEWIKTARRPYRHHHRHHRRLPRRDRAGFRRDPAPAGRGAVRFAVQLQILAAPQHRRAGHGRPHPRRGKAAPPGDPCRRSSAPSRSAATPS